MRTGVIVIGLISAGLVIGGTIWYFNSKKPKKSGTESDTDNKPSEGSSSTNEDIPDTTKTVSSPAQQTPSSSSSSQSMTSTTSSSGSASSASSPNVLSEVMKKLGAGARLKNNQVFAPFNNNKNIAIFYSNGRFSIFKIGEEKKGYLLKGVFKNGGLTLIPDGGKPISSGSAWTNLNTLPFKK